MDFTVPKFDLTGKVAIVTGGTKGIGYAIAITFAQYGADVVIASRTVADCERVAKQIEAMGRKALSCPTDVRKLDQIQNLVDKTMDKFGKIDILVNNAGIGLTTLAVDVTEEEWDDVVNIDQKGLFFLAQAAGMVMIKQGYGNVINVASVAGLASSSRLVPYMGAKAAVVHMTKGLALEWARFNIRVNGIAPGYILTPMTEETLAHPKAYEAIVGMVPQKKVGNIEDIAAVALFLASDASKFITGQTIASDGGRTVW